jgi:Bacterial mobilisation protein (MobC)
MKTRVHLSTWIDIESREGFAKVARAQGLTESALLRRMVEAAVLVAGEGAVSPLAPIEPVAATGRISVRLREDDLLLLRERAATRQLPTGTYVSYLVRAHLRAQTPLPTAELEALKRAVAEVGALGRNINQIAHAVNQQQWPGGPNKADLLAILRALSGLRDHTKALIKANLMSWELGYDIS